MSGIDDDQVATNWDDYDYEDWDDFVERPAWSYREDNTSTREQDEAIAEEVQELDQLVEQSEDEVDELEDSDDQGQDEEDENEIEEISSGEDGSAEEQELSRKQRRRLALNQALTSASSSSKPCRCGSTTHQTTSHRECPLHEKKMPDVQKDEYPQPFTIKTCLDTVCQHDDVKQTIRVVCTYITRLCHISSMFINFLVLRMLQTQTEIEKLDHNFVYTCMSLVAGEGSKATPFMRDTLEQFKTTAWDEAFNSSLRNIGHMKVVSYAAKSYATSIRLHMAENIEKRTKRYLFTLMSDASGEYYLSIPVKNRRSLAQHIWSRKLNPASHWPSSVPRTETTENVVERLEEHFAVCPVPVDENVYSQPQLYLPWMQIIQTYMSRLVHVTEPVAQEKVSKGYIHRKLGELNFMKGLNSNAQKSLELNVLHCINLQKPFVKTKKLHQMNHNDVNIVAHFIKTVQDRIKDGTFSPDKYTDPRGTRFFTLLPVYSSQDKFIHIDGEILWKIASGHRKRKRSSLDTKKELFSTVFDIKAIQKETEKKQFCYVATSDGVAINFHYRRIQKKKTEEQKNNPFTPAHLKNTMENQQVTVWGVDPGVRSVYTAVDNNGRTRSMSSNEYYQRIGQTSYKRFVERRKQLPANAEIVNIISTLPTLKTGDLVELRNAVDTRIRCYQDMKTYYAYLNKWSLELYRRKQRCLREMVAQLVGGSRKYNHNSSNYNRRFHDDHYNKPNPKDRPGENNKVIIAFGGAVFRAGVGCRSGPLKSFYNALYHYAIQHRDVYLIKVNEYYTSQVCVHCQKRTLVNKKNALGTGIHAVLKCSGCGRIMNRDENAGMNIRDILVYSCYHDNNRPEPFEIPENN